MGKIRCLVVDDEPLARELIETHIQAVEILECVTSCDDAMKAFEVLNATKIDLMFLDIQMPLITGLDFLKSLKNAPKVIITSAFRNYALEGYELDVVDYLLKPVTFQRFFKAIEKYNQTRTGQNRFLKDSNELNFIYLRSNKKNYKVYISDIQYIESLKDYISIHTEKGTLVIKQPISEIESILPQKKFLRIHRSYLINIEKISSFTANDIDINTKELPIGTSYKQQVSNALNSIP